MWNYNGYTLNGECAYAKCGGFDVEHHCPFQVKTENCPCKYLDESTCKCYCEEAKQDRIKSVSKKFEYILKMPTIKNINPQLISVKILSNELEE